MMDVYVVPINEKHNINWKNQEGQGYISQGHAGVQVTDIKYIKYNGYWRETLKQSSCRKGMQTFNKQT